MFFEVLLRTHIIGGGTSERESPIEQLMILEAMRGSHGGESEKGAELKPVTASQSGARCLCQ